MKIRAFTFTAVAALVALLAFSGSGFAARKVCDDGTFPPCADSGSGTEPPDFGDLIILYRDPSGVPYLTTDSCQQPLPSDTSPEACKVEGDPFDVDVKVIPVDPLTCAVRPDCATYTEEVDFGRVNVSRAPASVFEQQLADVVVNLATADCTTLDPAGRLVANRVVVNSDTEEEEVLTSTIDSPLQNLAIYRQLMLTGTLGAPLPEGATTLDTAARGLGVGSDKTGEVNVDVVAYLNSIMGLSAPGTVTILDPKICINVKQEVQGVVQLVEECFLDYSAYGYDRLANFSTTQDSLPSPAYIPGTPETPLAGWFEYLALLVPPLEIEPLFEIVQGPILDAVFCVDADGLPVDAVDGLCVDPPNAIDEGFQGGNIGGFAQAADDTRAVINFMHDWPMPDAAVYATPVPCVASGDIAYDVSISEESGFQVPKNIVDGSSDREFIVTVANAGPDAATVTLTVTAIPDAGGTVLANLDGDDPDVGFIPSPFVFEPIVIEAETSETFTALISVDIGQRTTINWTAVAAAPDDVNLSNNSATAVSNVKVTGSGGGGNGGQGGNPN